MRLTVVLLVALGLMVELAACGQTPNTEPTVLPDLSATAEASVQATIAAQPNAPETYSKYYDKGIEYFNEDEYDKAIDSFNKAIELNPNYAEAYYERGRAYGNLEVILNRDDKDYVAMAMEDFGRAIELNPDHAAAYSRRGYSFALKEDFVKAFSDLEKSVALDPGYAGAYYYRGKAYFLKEDYDSAISDFKKAFELDSNDTQAKISEANAYYMRGAVYFSQRDNDSAFDDFDRAIKLNPDHDYAYIGRGTIYASRGNYDRAFADFERAIELDPNNTVAKDVREHFYKSRQSASTQPATTPSHKPAAASRASVYYRLGVDLMNEGEYDEAIYNLNKAIELNQDYTDKANADKAQAYFLKGVNDRSDVRESIANLNTAIKLNPNHADAYYWRAQFFILVNHFSNAWADLSKVIELNPDHVDAYYWRGQIQHGNGNYDIAITSYTKAIQLDPAGGYHMARGLAYADKGSPDKAIADYNEVIKSSEDRDYYPYFVRGLAFVAKGNLDKAIADFDKAIQINPNYTPAQDARESAYKSRQSAPEPSINSQWDAPPPMTIDTNKDYMAVIELEKGGEIVIDLFEEGAPITVNNFVFLAREGFYDGVTFHRVLENFMAQTGDPTGTGGGGPGYRFNNELSPDLRHDGPGVLSMANAGSRNGQGTNGSQFFITFRETHFLDGYNLDGSEKDCEADSCHSVFGQVVEGMDVVMDIGLRDLGSATTPGDAIKTIRIELK